MIAFDARRVDEDLVERLGQRQAVDLAAVELDRDRGLRLAAVSRLIEVGAQRRGHGVDEVAQDAVLVEAFDRAERGLDLGDQRRLLLGALVLRHFELRIEALVEQLHDLRRDAGMAPQGRPHVVLRIGHAHLAQEARDGAHQRDVAPLRARGQHQRVVAVVLGAAAHHRHEAGFQPRLQRVEVERRAVRALQHHVVQPHLGGAGIARLDLVGALVHHLEAHVLQHGHALGERDRVLAAPHFQAGAGGIALAPAVEVGAERADRREAFDQPDVRDRDRRHVGFAIAGRERLAIAARELLRLDRLVHQRERLGERVGPGAHDLLDRAFQHRAVRIRRLARMARDDEVHAHQRPFGEGRIERRDAPVVGARQIAPDRDADRRSRSGRAARTP